jgi:hypothetical protein
MMRFSNRAPAKAGALANQRGVRFPALLPAQAHSGEEIA